MIICCRQKFPKDLVFFSMSVWFSPTILMLDSSCLFFFWLQLLKSKLTAFLSDMKWRGFGFWTVGWRKKQSEDVTLGSGQLWLVFFTFSWCFIDRPVNYSKLHYYSILLLPSAWKAWRTVTTANNSGNECLYHNLIHFCDWQSKMWGGTDLVTLRFIMGSMKRWIGLHCV